MDCEDRHDLETLVRQAQAGDSAAFRALLEAHYDDIYRLAFRKVGAVPDAQDIAQEVCLILAEKLGGFRHQATFRSWLYRLTINAANDWLRTMQRHRRHADDQGGSEEIADLSPGPEARAQAHDILRQIGALPAKIQDAVILVHLEGLTHKDAAQVLNCAETTISWRLFRARKDLAHQLSEPITP